MIMAEQLAMFDGTTPEAEQKQSLCREILYREAKEILTNMEVDSE